MQRRTVTKTEGRKCLICAKDGGIGFTTALRLSGIFVPEGHIGYAHSDCFQNYRTHIDAVKRKRL